MIASNTVAIQRLFCDYVQSTENRPRHTVQANQEVGNFSAFCAGAFGGQVRLQNELYERMMDCAVEFEESGFIAGFLYAYKLLNP